MNNNIWIKFYKNNILEEVTFNEAEVRVSQKKKDLLNSGLIKGDIVVVLLPNSIETIVMYLALYELKIIIIPLIENTFIGRLKYIIEECNARAIINDSGIEFINNNNKKNEFENKLSKISTIIYTSGTTGNPKGVCLSWDNWMTNVNSIIRHHNLTEDSIISTCLPLSHCNAHGFAFLASYVSKSRLILFDKYCENMLDIIKNERVNILSIVPAILFKLFKENPNWNKYPDLKYILTAAAPLNFNLFKNIYYQWGVKIIQGFGLSESTNFSCTFPTEISESEYVEIMSPQPSIGVVLNGVNIKIGQDDLEGKVGEVLINSKSNFFGYFKDGLFEQNSEIQTGDLGFYKTYRNKRYYYLTGRIKELINRGGEKLSPLEIELELSTLGFTGEYSIIKISSEKFGEEVALATTKLPDLKNLYKIPWYRRPKVVFIISNLNTTETGKVQRGKIAEECMLGNYLHKYIIKQ